MKPLPEEELGAYIRRVRESKGLTRDQVGERAGISGGYISQIEGGTATNPTTRILKKLAVGVGTDEDYIFEIVRKRPSIRKETFRNSNLYLLYERAKKADPETRQFIERQVEMLLGYLAEKEKSGNEDRKATAQV